MKSLLIGVVVAALLFGTIAGANLLYKNLGEEYNKENESMGGLEVFEGDEGLRVFEALSTEKIPHSTGGNKEETKVPQITTGAVETEKNNDVGATTQIPPAADVTESKPAETQAPSEAVTTITPKPEVPKVTLSVPDFEVLDYNGNKVRLSDFAGKPIVINFWATWCYYCKVEMPDFDRAYEEYPDVVFLMVNATDGVSETVESVKKFIEKEGYGFDVYFDTTEQALDAYGVTSFPSTYFINADGKLAVRKIGMLDYENIKLGLSYITE